MDWAKRFLKEGRVMKSHQWALIVSTVPFVLSVICGCAILGSKADRSVMVSSIQRCPVTMPLEFFATR